MENLLISLQQVAILVIEIGVGYVAARRGKIPASALGVLTYLCCSVALPCAIIYPIVHLDNSPALWASLGSGLAVIAVFTLVQIGVCLLLFRGEDARRRPVYQMATVYGNSAFMGIPLVTAIVGTDGVIYATLMVIFDTVFLFTHASLAMSGERPSAAFIAKKVFGLATISTLIGIALLLSGIQLPEMAMTCMSDLKGMMTPVAMLIVGGQLAQQDFKKIFIKPKRHIVSIIKLAVWPLALMACLMPFAGALSSVAIISIVVCKATPQSAVLGVLAQQNDLDGEEAAAVMGLTTILSVVTLPIMASLAQAFFL